MLLEYEQNGNKRRRKSITGVEQVPAEAFVLEKVARTEFPPRLSELPIKQGQAVAREILSQRATPTEPNVLNDPHEVVDSGQAPSSPLREQTMDLTIRPLKIPKAPDLGYQAPIDTMGTSRIPRPSQISPQPSQRSPQPSSSSQPSAAPIRAPLPELYHNYDAEVPMEMTVPMTAQSLEHSAEYTRSPPQEATQHYEVPMDETEIQPAVRHQPSHSTGTLHNELATEETNQVNMTQNQEIPMVQTQHRSVQTEQSQSGPMENTQYQNVPMDMTQHQQVPMEMTQYQQVPMEMTQQFRVSSRVGTETPSTALQPEAEDVQQHPEVATPTQSRQEQIPSESQTETPMELTQSFPVESRTVEAPVQLSQAKETTHAQDEVPMEMTQSFPSITRMGQTEKAQAEPLKESTHTSPSQEEVPMEMTQSFPVGSKKAQDEPPKETTEMTRAQDDVPMELTRVHQYAQQVNAMVEARSSSETPVNNAIAHLAEPVTQQFSDFSHVEVSRSQTVYTENGQLGEVTMEFTQLKQTTVDRIEPPKLDEIPMDFTEPSSHSKPIDSEVVSKEVVVSAQPEEESVGSTQLELQDQQRTSSKGDELVASTQLPSQHTREPLAPLAVPDHEQTTEKSSQQVVEHNQDNRANEDDMDIDNEGAANTPTPVEKIEPPTVQQDEPLQNPPKAPEGENFTDKAEPKGDNIATSESVSTTEAMPQEMSTNHNEDAIIEILRSPVEHLLDPRQISSDAREPEVPTIDNHTNGVDADQTFAENFVQLSPEIYHTPSALPLKYAENLTDLPLTPRAPLTPNEVLQAPPAHYAARTGTVPSDDEYSLLLSQDPQIMDTVAQEYVYERPEPIRGYQQSVSVEEFVNHLRNRGPEHMDTLYEVTEVSESDHTQNITNPRESILPPETIAEPAQVSETVDNDYIPTLSDPNLARIDSLISGDDPEMSRVIDELRLVIDDDTLLGVCRKIGLTESAEVAILWSLSWGATTDSQQVLKKGSAQWVTDIVGNVKENLPKVSDYYARANDSKGEEFDQAVYQIARVKVKGVKKQWQYRAIRVLAAFAKVERAQQWITSELESFERTKEDALSQLEQLVDHVSELDEDKENQEVAAPEKSETPEENAVEPTNDVSNMKSPTIDEESDASQIEKVVERSFEKADIAPAIEPDMAHLTPVHHNRPKPPVASFGEDQRFWLDPQTSPLPSPPQPLKPPTLASLVADIDGFTASYSDDMMVTGVVNRHLNVTLTSHSLTASCDKSMVWRYAQLKEALPYLLSHIEDQAYDSPRDKLAQLARLWRSLCQFDRELGVIDINTRVVMMEIIDAGIYCGLIHLNRTGKIEIRMLMLWAGLETFQCEVTTEVVRGSFAGWTVWQQPNALFDHLGKAIAASIDA